MRNSATAVANRKHGPRSPFGQFQPLQFAATLCDIILVTRYPSTLFSATLIFIAILILQRAHVGTRVAFAALTMYASGPWLSAWAGEIYPPYFSDEQLYATARISMISVMAAYAILELLRAVIAPNSRVSKADNTSSYFTGRRFTRTGYTITSAVLWLAFALDLRNFLQVGIQAVLSGSRREYAAQLYVASEHNWSIIVIAFGAFAIATSVNETPWRQVGALAPVAGIALLLLLVGSRQPLMVLVVTAMPAVLKAAKRKWPVWAFILIGALLLLFLPMFFGEGSKFPPEWGLPGYTTTAVLTGYLSPHFIHYDFVAQAGTLLPSFLRLGIPTVFPGEAYGALGIQSVAIGATPWFEGSLWMPQKVIFASVLLIVITFTAWYLLSRLSGAFYLSGLASVIVLGRSTMWLTLFYMAYIGTLLILLRAVATQATGSNDDGSRPLTPSAGGPLDSSTVTVPYVLRRWTKA